MSVFRIELPLVPSLNNAYATNRKTGRRFTTKKVREWKENAGWLVTISKPPKIDAPYSFDIYLPAQTRGDCSNRIKIAEDLLVELGVTPDDSCAVSSCAYRADWVPPGRCIVVVGSEGQSNVS